MDDSFTSKIVVNNEYDYSNLLPTVEGISQLVEYCDGMNNQLTKLVEADEEKNKQFKAEYKEYTYKKSYGQQLEINIREKSYNRITCKNYLQFRSIVQGGNLNGIDSMEITLCLDFYRGKGDNLEEHENSFLMKFRPYEITFIRKSNHDDLSMNRIEQQIKNIFEQFPVADCIFCSKQNNQ